MTTPLHDGVIREAEPKITFGPVPSRRLGRSLGINNIPPKICTYSCVYCQLGRTGKMQVERRPFYGPSEVLRTAYNRVWKAEQAGEPIDYLTFVPDGEPTLDINLGQEIELMKNLGIRIAVITSASLIWHKDVREDLMGADWVSLKVDAVDEEIWQRVNRPHGRLKLASILEGALEFAEAYDGDLVTETMLVEGINDGAEQIRRVAGFLARLKPATAYLAVPTRPPAEKWVRSPIEKVINQAYQLFGERLDRVEYLIGYEGNAFAFTGNLEDDLLSITAVHPMREDAVTAFLEQAGAEWAAVHRLVAQDQLVEAEYRGHLFYLRRLGKHINN
jgi:wyosine [tRNA(Phe)-imidazoG37] synthetase (radical SAM superfamily)